MFSEMMKMESMLGNEEEGEEGKVETAGCCVDEARLTCARIAPHDYSSRL